MGYRGGFDVRVISAGLGVIRWSAYTAAMMSSNNTVYRSTVMLDERLTLPCTEIIVASCKDNTEPRTYLGWGILPLPLYIYLLICF